MQFTDLQEHLTPFQRRFVSGVKRCEELERKCRFFTGEIAKFGLKLASAGAASSFLDAPLGGSSPGAILSSLESELEEYEKQVPFFKYRYHQGAWLCACAGGWFGGRRRLPHPSPFVGTLP
jgi:V-type H+-transporting ATPase subunit a